VNRKAVLASLYLVIQFISLNVIVVVLDVFVVVVVVVVVIPVCVSKRHCFGTFLSEEQSLGVAVQRLVI
jgi:hypothetical protein